MTPEPQWLVYRDAEEVAHQVADLLVREVVSAIAARGSASVCLTGGGVGIGVLRALAEPSRLATIDWSRVTLWWGDERFLPDGDPDRNETQARSALLDKSELALADLRPMPSSSGPLGDDPDAAAADYDAEMSGVGSFDVVLLGVGPDGHIASLFPGRAELAGTGNAIPVRHSPKPPPTRISLTLPRLCDSRAVWLLAAGAEKAEVVGQLRGLRGMGGEARELPAALVHGRESTLIFADEASAG